MATRFEEITDQCSLVSEPIDLNDLAERARTDESGAVALFMGTVRNHHEGRQVESLQYEAYGPMAETQMKKNCRRTSVPLEPGRRGYYPPHRASQDRGDQRGRGRGGGPQEGSPGRLQLCYRSTQGVGPHLEERVLRGRIRLDRRSLGVTGRHPAAAPVGASVRTTQRQDLGSEA